MNAPRGTISPVLIPEKKVLNESSMTPIPLFDRICWSASVRPHLFGPHARPHLFVHNLLDRICSTACSTASVCPHLFDRMLDCICLSASVRPYLFVRTCSTASARPYLFHRMLVTLVNISIFNLINQSHHEKIKFLSDN
jgi:hypothetical protein